MGPGGVCSFPFAGAPTACPMTTWGYYYATAASADEVAATRQACETQWGGTWTDL
jgi:hypothetical protein